MLKTTEINVYGTMLEIKITRGRNQENFTGFLRTLKGDM